MYINRDIVEEQFKRQGINNEGLGNGINSPWNQDGANSVSASDAPVWENGE